MNIKQNLPILLGLSVLAFGCSTEEMAPSNEIPADAKAQLEEMGFSTVNATTFRENDPVAGPRAGYLVEGDLKITQDMLLAEASPFDNFGPKGEQYFSGYTVLGLPRTINVLGYTGGANALTSNMQTGLQFAIDNYNALNLLLSFNLTFGTNTGPADIVVYKVTSGAAGGSAGFPSGGNPYKWVQINSGTAAYSTNVIEHVLGHEIGHCLGMVHTGIRDPASCNYSPTARGYHIPGTPTGDDPDSIWTSCFNASVDGEFSAYDVIALDYLY